MQRYCPRERKRPIDDDERINYRYRWVEKTEVFFLVVAMQEIVFCGGDARNSGLWWRRKKWWFVVAGRSVKSLPPPPLGLLALAGGDHRESYVAEKKLPVMRG